MHLCTISILRHDFLERKREGGRGTRYEKVHVLQFHPPTLLSVFPPKSRSPPHTCTALRPIQTRTRNTSRDRIPPSSSRRSIVLQQVSESPQSKVRAYYQPLKRELREMQRGRRTNRGSHL